MVVVTSHKIEVPGNWLARIFYFHTLRKNNIMLEFTQGHVEHLIVRFDDTAQFALPTSLNVSKGKRSRHWPIFAFEELRIGIKAVLNCAGNNEVNLTITCILCQKDHFKAL